MAVRMNESSGRVPLTFGTLEVALEYQVRWKCICNEKGMGK